MLGVFEASPGLESLSLYQLLPKLHPDRQYTPARTAKFARLKSLVLDSYPMLVGYILGHMEIPAIEHLKIRTDLSPGEVEAFLHCIFPDNHLPGRLFPNPPRFEIWPDCGDGIYDALKVNIGNCHIQFDFDIEFSEEVSDAIMAWVLPLVPKSATTLRLDHTRLEETAGWRDFFSSHPEVHSIEFSKKDSIEESMWDALSPLQTGGLTLCPKLESIALSKQPVSVALIKCLLERMAAGFKLRRLKLCIVTDELAEALRPFVEEVQVFNELPESVRRVRLGLCE
jgi:hypothetical protein